MVTPETPTANLPPMEETPSRRGPVEPIGRRHGLLLLLILCVATSLRLYQLESRGYWYDEMFTTLSSRGTMTLIQRQPRDAIIESPPTLLSPAVQGSWIDVYRFLRSDPHPPLHNFTHRLWTMMTGDGVAASRMLSVIFSLLAIVLLFDVVRHAANIQAALWACALMALAAPMIRYAQEARAYMMLIPELLIAIGAVVRIERYGWNWRRLTALALGCAAMMATHYFALGSLVGLGVYAVIRLRGADRPAAVGAFVASACLFVILLGPYAWRQRNNAQAGNVQWLNEPSEGHLGRLALRLASHPARYIADNLDNVGIFLPAAAFLMLIPLVQMRRHRELWLWGLVLAGTIAMPATLDALRSTKHLVFIRYTLPAAAVFYVLIVLSAQRLRATSPYVLGALVLCCILSLPRAYADRHGDISGMAATLKQHVGQGDIVVFEKNHPYQHPNGLYLVLSRYIGDFPSPLVFQYRERVTDEVLARLHGANKVWLVDNSMDGPAGRSIPNARLDPIAEYRQLGRLYQVRFPDVARPAANP